MPRSRSGYGPFTGDHSLGGADSKRGRRATLGVAAKMVVESGEKLSKYRDGGGPFNLSRLQIELEKQAAIEARRKAAVSEMLGKGFCRDFLYGVRLRVVSAKNAGNRYGARALDERDDLYQVQCPDKPSLRCKGCIRNALDDGKTDILASYTEEVKVAIGRLNG